jgi:hypothetical protein
MKLYKISQKLFKGCDSAVVCAENEQEATKEHPKGIWLSYYAPGGVWTLHEDAKLEYLGEAKEGMEKGVICDNFTVGY